MTFRCGDHVKHLPSGETWVVAYVDGDYLGWCGWPAGEAPLKDFELARAVDDERHMEMLGLCAKSDGKRASMAQRALAALATDKSS